MHSNVSKSFSLYRNEEYLHDVTLVSDDHNKVSAHKLVLSACSDYFRDIFKNNPHSHPLLCLDGISSEDLKNILSYVYNGEVQIEQENLDRFLTVAKRLELQGLIGGNEQVHEDIDDNKNSINELLQSNEEAESASISDHIPSFKSEKIVNKKMDKPVGTVAVADNVEEQVNQYLEECPGGYKCTFCGKTCIGKSSKRDTQRHIETHIEGLSYECQICHKILRSSDSIRQHKYKYHK